MKKTAIVKAMLLILWWGAGKMPVSAMVLPAVDILAENVDSTAIDNADRGWQKKERGSYQPAVLCDICNEKSAGAVVNSYDPHSQLIYFTDEESATVTLFVDAYLGQALTVYIYNEKEEEMAVLDIEKVERFDIAIDWATWDCGKYTIVVAEQDNKNRCYSFFIK